MSRNFHRGPSQLKRKTPRVPSSGKAFLIVTEGAKTEPNYFEALRKRLQLNSADVEIFHPPGTDPITLTKRAIELQTVRKSRAKKEDFVVEYDEVWVVFDLEKTHDERRALAKQAHVLPGANSILFAESDPCFEYWLLLHKAYTVAPLEDCDSVVRELRKHWANYSKGETPTIEFIERLHSAARHAAQCREHHKNSGGDGNPSTNIDTLALKLNTATKPDYRIK